MNIQVQISDEVYKSLVAGGNRVKGTIALVSPNEGNFNAWRTSNGKREIRHTSSSLTAERAWAWRT